LHVALSLLTLDPGRVGGSETYVRGLLAAFAAGAGPERVTVLAGPDVAETLDSGGPVTVATVDGLALGEGRAGRALGLLRGMVLPPARARAAAAAADVLHHPFTVPVPRAPGPSVLTLYDLLHHDVPQHFSRAERAFRTLAYDRAAKRATRVVTISEHSRRRIQDVLDVPGDRVAVIEPGLDHARFRPDAAANDAALLAGLALPASPWLLYPAALWPHKNHAALLEALARTPGDLSLVLTGATFGREGELRQAARRHGVGERVHHLGWVAPEALAPLYRAATGLVFPSLAEGFGQPPLEAMACGCPVAASGTGALAEACGGAALTFAPTDVAGMAAAMTRLAADDGVRGELREAGLQRAGAFTWERAAALHAEVYEAASNPRRR
jgi:glycosyltransferase involved in cell wall biosynthesis